jgi:hypothetical protein
MPSHHGLRPLKAWRYVGVYAPELMLCMGSVRIGRARQSFWAIWDRRGARLYERTRLGRGEVELTPGHAAVTAREARVELVLDESSGVETISPAGASYAWTRKQGGIRAYGRVTLGGRPLEFEARGVIDDTAGFYERHTCWRWWAGVGRCVDGRRVAWNLVTGVHDAPVNSERTVWVDDEPRELGPGAIDGLRFAPEAVRRRRDNLLVLRSSYRQPFGTFSGRLPGGLELAEGYGVSEEHEAWW